LLSCNHAYIAFGQNVCKKEGKGFAFLALQTTKARKNVNLKIASLLKCMFLVDLKVWYKNYLNSNYL
jgi:hypothetical protein